MSPPNHTIKWLTLLRLSFNTLNIPFIWLGWLQSQVPKNHLTLTRMTRLEKKIAKKKQIKAREERAHFLPFFSFPRGSLSLLHLFASPVGMRRLWRWYQQCLATHPVRTQVVSSGILWGLGDIGAQTVTHYSGRPDRRGHASSPPEVAAATAPIGHRIYRSLRGLCL